MIERVSDGSAPLATERHPDERSPAAVGPHPHGQTLGIIESVCPACRRVVPAKVLVDNGNVVFEKFCPEHGTSRCAAGASLKDFLGAQRFVKPALLPREHQGDATRPCPEGCGFCGRHEQHLCLPIIEVTRRCNLCCPICLVDAGGGWEITPDEFRHMVDALVRAEDRIDVLNLSGGEPLVHPRILELLDEALSRPEIVRVSVSTNGLALLHDRALLEGLRERNVVVSLQFDGVEDGPYLALRGVPLAVSKHRILDALGEADITTSLTMTAASGVSEGQFSPILDLLFTREHIASLMVQPIAFTGRAEGLPGREGRMTARQVIQALADAGRPEVSSGDFVPLPCSHPACFTLAFYLVLEGGDAVSINRLVRADDLLGSVANRVFFGLDADEYERIKGMVYDVWSGPTAAVPNSERALAAMRRLLRALDGAQASNPDSGFDPRIAFTVAERGVKSIFIHSFQDADTFDLARVRRCCNAYPQPDGTLLPACSRNVLYEPDPAGPGFRLRMGRT